MRAYLIANTYVPHCWIFSVIEVVLYRTGTYFCMDKSVTAVVIKVSAPHFLYCLQYCNVSPSDGFMH